VQAFWRRLERGRKQARTPLVPVVLRFQSVREWLSGAVPQILHIEELSWQ
jgi:hypothetical protein